MARRKKGSKFIQGAIKRPGALTRAKKKGESTRSAAQRLKKSGSPRQKSQANFYLNVLAPAAKKRGSKKSTSSRRRRVGSSHRVKSHMRTVGKGRRIRV